MIVIVGLGNPGFRYRKTKHNIGFMVLEALAKRWKKRFRGKGHYRFVETTLGSKRVLLLKPVTYMNRSGVAVGDIVHRYNIDFSRLLVVCDDLNLPLGRIRLRKSGSHGGHKGLASIIDHLDSNEFPRLRLGIDYNVDCDAAEYVLTPFCHTDLPVVHKMINRGCEAIGDFIEKGIQYTMNSYN